MTEIVMDVHSCYTTWLPNQGRGDGRAAIRFPPTCDQSLSRRFPGGHCCRIRGAGTRLVSTSGYIRDAVTIIYESPDMISCPISMDSWNALDCPMGGACARPGDEDLYSNSLSSLGEVNFAT